MSVRRYTPDPESLLERMAFVASQMKLPIDLADELISDLIFRWWARGWEDVPFPAPAKMDGWIRRCFNNWRKTKNMRDSARTRRELEFSRRNGSRRSIASDENLIGEELKFLFLQIVEEEGTQRSLRVVSWTMRGRTVSEIAEDIGLSRATVKREMARVRALLRRRLDDAGI